MTIYDAAMIGVLVLGMIWGAIRGITWQLASIASLMLGYLVAFPLSGQLVSHFPGDPVVARALAMLSCYVGVSGGVFLAAWLVRTTLRQWQFEAYDRHLGMILGGLEGALLGMLATVFVVSLAPQTREPIFSSRAGHVVCNVLNAVEPVLPGEIRAELAPFWTEAGGVAGAERHDEDRPQARVGMRTPPADRAQAPGPDSGSASLQGLIQEGEAALGRAVVEAAEQNAGGTSRGHDREAERR